MSVISKGRGSSNMLKPLLSRLAVLLLTCDTTSSVQKTLQTMPAGDANLWPGQSARAERREARRNIVLEDVGITANTLERYYHAVGRLAPFLQ